MAQVIGYTGTLKLGEQTYQINSCSIAFRRDTGPDGRPSSTIYGGKIMLTAPTTTEVNLAISMINLSSKMVAGEINLWEAGGKEGVFRTIVFTEAFLCDYQETFDINGSGPFTCSFTISAETISIGTAKLNNNWPKNS